MTHFGDGFTSQSTFSELNRSSQLSLEQESKLLDTFASPTQPSLLPRFLNYRELLTFLYHNKGIDLQPIKNLVATYDNEPLIEVIAFILDRPIAPDEQLHLHSPLQIKNGVTNPADIKFGASNNNFELTDIQQNVLLPGHRCQEIDVIDYLGLSHGCRQQSTGGFILLKYLTISTLSVDMMLQWDIMRIIRSRNWMDELYLGSTFRDTVYNSPFRQYLKLISRAVTINALDEGLVLLKLKHHLLKLSFGSAHNPHYQDHINLWLGTQYNRQFQTLVRAFHPTDLGTIESDFHVRTYFEYIDAIHGILANLFRDLALSPDLDVFTILFNNQIPFIPLFTNDDPQYPFRLHSHHNSDVYDGTPQAPALQLTTHQSSPTIEVNGILYPVWPHRCSFRTSPLLRHIFHIRAVQQHCFSIHTLTSRILQLEYDINRLKQAQQLQEEPGTQTSSPDFSLCLKTNATLIPTYLNLQDLEYTLQLYKDMSKSAYNMFVFYIKMFGVDVFNTQVVVLTYFISKLYNETELCTLLTHYMGITDDNMWKYNHIIRQKYEIDPFEFVWDVFCLPLAPTPIDPHPTTRITRINDPNSYYSKDMIDTDPDTNTSTDAVSGITQGGQKVLKGIKNFSLMDRVQEFFRITMDTSNIPQYLLISACSFHLDHIIALFDSSTDFFHKAPDETNTITQLISSGTSCVYPHGMISNDELCPQFYSFLAPYFTKNDSLNDIAWFTSKVNFSELPMAPTATSSLIGYSFFSTRTPRLTLLKFLVSPHHGQIALFQSNLIFIDWYYDPISVLLTRGCISYGKEICASNKGKKNANLIALPKLTDIHDIIIVDAMGNPVNPSDNVDNDNNIGDDNGGDNREDGNTTHDNENQVHHRKIKLRLTAIECAQYQILSQDKINQCRQDDFSNLFLGLFPSLLLPYAFKLLLNHTKNSKKLFSNVLKLSQSVIDEVLAAEADAETEKNKNKNKKNTLGKTNQKTASVAATVAKTPQVVLESTKQLVLPRISKPRVPNASFWNLLSTVLPTTAVNISHFQSIHNLQALVEVVSILFTNNFFTISSAPYSIDSKTISVVPSASPNQDLCTCAKTSGMTVLRDIMQKIHTFSHLSSSSSQLWPQIENQFMTLFVIIFPPSSQLTRSFIRNGPMAYFDYLDKLCPRPLVQKQDSSTVTSPSPNADEWTEKYKSSRRLFHAFFTYSLIAFLQDCSKLVPNVAKWFVDQFKTDISIAILCGDDCEDSVLFPAHLKTPTHISRAKNTATNAAKNSTSLTDTTCSSSSTPPKFEFTRNVVYAATIHLFVSNCIASPLSSLSPRFFLSDVPHLPTMESVLSSEDMVLQDHTITFYSNQSEIIQDVGSTLHGTYIDYIPPQFVSSLPNHILPFLPLSIQSNPIIQHVLFPYQHYNFKLVSSSTDSTTLQDTPLEPLKLSAKPLESLQVLDSNQSAISSTSIPIYSLAPFVTTISETFSHSSLANYSTYSHLFQYQFFYTSLYSSSDDQAIHGIDTIKNVFTKQVPKLYDIIPSQDLPHFFLRPEQYPNSIAPDIAQIWGENTPLPPLYPWQLYSYMFHTQSTVDSGLPKGDWLDESNDREEFSLRLSYIPIIRYPQQSILSFQLRLSSQSIQSYYSDQLSCVGQSLPVSSFDTWTARQPFAIQPQTIQVVPFDNCPINTEYKTHLQKGIDVEPLGFKNHAHPDLLKMMSGLFSPMALRIEKYLSTLIALNQNTQTHLQNYTLTSFELFAPISSLISPFLLTSVCDQLFPNLIDHAIDNDSDNNQDNQNAQDNQDGNLVDHNNQDDNSVFTHISLFNRHRQALVKRISIAFPTVSLLAIESHHRTNLLSKLATQRHHNALYCPVLTQLTSYHKILNPVVHDKLPPIQQYLKLFKNAIHASDSFSTTRATWSTDLAYNGLVTDDFLNTIGTFTPDEVSNVFSKWISYLTTTTNTSHYRDGKQFAELNYIRFTPCRTPCKDKTAYDTGITLPCEENIVSNTHISSSFEIMDYPTCEDSITWKFAQLRREYLDFIFHQYNNNSASRHSMQYKETTGFLPIEPLPQPFSNKIYMHNPEHIVNRYNKFVETQLSSKSRYNCGSPQLSAQNDVVTMYGTRIVFDFDQFLQSPSLGSISYIPNISTKADPTTSTAKITAANPEHDYFQTYGSGQSNYNIPNTCTVSHCDRYLLNPETYAISPITTPLYNNPNDNIINFPPQYYQSLYSIIARCVDVAENTTIYPRNEAAPSHKYDAWYQRVLLYEKHANPKLLTFFNDFHRIHHFTTPNQVTTFYGNPSTTTFGNLGLPLSLQSCKGTLPPTIEIESLWPLTLQQTKELHAMDYIVPIGQYDSPKVVSTRYLMIILQQFTAQPISPNLMLNYCGNYFSSPTLITNLIDIVLQKTNGDLWHSWISRSFYTLGRDNSNLQFKNFIQRFKLEPIDYYHYISPIFSLMLSSGTAMKPFGEQLMQSFMLLSAKYNLTSEPIFQKLKGLPDLLAIVSQNPGIWNLDPQQPPRGKKLSSSHDFYQFGENINDEPSQSGFLTNLINKLNPMKMNPSVISSLVISAPFLAAASYYYYYHYNRRDREHHKSTQPASASDIHNPSSQ